MTSGTILAAGLALTLASGLAAAQMRETTGTTIRGAPDPESLRQGDGTDQRPESGRMPDPRAGSGADSGGKGTGSAGEVAIPGKGAPAPEGSNQNR